MWNRLFKIDVNYNDDLQRQHARLLINFVTIVGFATILYAVFFTSTQYAPYTLIEYIFRTGNLGDIIPLVLFFLFGGLTLFFVRIGQLDRASWMAFVALCFTTIGNTYNSGLVNGFNTLLMVITVFVAGLILGRIGLFISAIVTIIGIAVALGIRPTLEGEVLPDYIVSGDAIAQYNVSDFLALSLITLGITAIINAFLRSATTSRQMGAYEAVQAQATVGGIVTDLTQRVAQRISVQELSEYTINRVLADFPKIYHAQIFLSDDAGAEARLTASTGEVGQKLIARAHGLKVGSVSVIGQVTYLGKYIIAKAGSSDSVHQRNELLPETQVEAAFPLRIGNRVIGALDLQSKERDGFDRDDLAQAFQTLADSIGLAIDNIRQFERAEQRVLENQRLVEEAREALRQVERLNERLTGRIWTDYISGAGQDIGLGVDFEANETISKADLTNSIAEAIQSGQIGQTEIDNRQIITIPLRVRGRVVGAMEFELDKEDDFSPDDLDLLTEVSERFGVAVENVRLVNESQRNAQREAYVNQIVGRLQTVNNVEDMVTEAAKGLRDALKAPKIAIKLGTPPR
jgi:GAF domain-containing protein